MAAKTISLKAALTGPNRKNNAWEIITDFKRFPQSVKAVNRIDILSRTDRDSRSQWFVTIDGAPLRWIQKETFEHEHLTFRFRSIDGDFDTFEGSWRIVDIVEEGIGIHLAIEFDLGIPVLETALGNELVKRIQVFGESLLDSVGTAMVPLQIEQRTGPRMRIDKHNSLKLNDLPVRALIRDISRRGVMIGDAVVEISGPADIHIGGHRLRGTIFSDGCGSHSSRIVFDQELTQKQVTDLAEELAATNARSNDRTAVKRRAGFSFADGTVPMMLLNISRGGMRIQCETTPECLRDPFELCGMLIVPRRVFPSGKRTEYRVAFAKELSDLELQTIIARMERDDTGPLLACETITSKSAASRHLRLVSKEE